MVLTEIIIALLAGSTGGAIINILYNHSIHKKNIKIKELKEKINHLYGNLSFMFIYTKKCLEQSKMILSEYNNYFIPHKFSQNEFTQSKLKAEADATIDLSNYYFNKVKVDYFY